MPTTTPAIQYTSSDHFILTNTGSKAVTFVMPRKKLIVQPGQWAEVTFSLIRIYFGDPRSVNGSRRMFKDGGGEGTIASREQEINRLKILYGVYGEDEEKLEDRAPNCIIKTLTTQDVIPPLYDRDGTKSTEAVISRPVATLNSFNDIAAIIRQHEEQLSQLRHLAVQAQINGPNDYTPEADTVDEGIG